MQVLNRFQPVKGATPYERVYGKNYKAHLAEYGEPVHGYKSLNKGEARLHVCLSLRKVERRDGRLCVDRWCAGSAKQMRQKNRSRLVQILANLQKPPCVFMGISDHFGAKRRAEALPSEWADIPREYDMLKFKGEDAEAALKEEVFPRKRKHDSQNQCRFQPRWKSLWKQ